MDLISTHRWKERVLIVSASSPTNVGFKSQEQMLKKDRKGMKLRDIVIYRLYTDHWINPTGELIDHQAVNEIYKAYNILPGQFAVILIDKDGETMLKGNDLISTKELFALVDSKRTKKMSV